MDPSALRPETLAVHAGHHPDTAFGAVAPPLVTTSTYLHGAPGERGYGRTTNPTWEALEELVAAFEGGAAAVAMASGMAAISAVLELVPPGGRVVAASNGYSGTRVLLRHLAATGRVSVALVPVEDTAAVAGALAPGADLLCLETISNPLLTVCDLPACIAAARGTGARVMVDNTLATPLGVHPLDLGADVVVHSLTKYVGGHSDLIAGCAVVRETALAERLRFVRQEVGGIPGQLEAWLALRGARTMVLRVERQTANAAELARRLEGHPEVIRVHHPGLASHPQHALAAGLLRGGACALVAVEVRGGAERADAVCEAAQLWAHTTSLGGVESMMERRSRYDVDAEVCSPGLIRLSAGVEHVDDLHADLLRALELTAHLAPGPAAPPR